VEPDGSRRQPRDLLVVNLEKPDYETLAHLIGPSYYLGNPGRIPVVQNFINTHPLISWRPVDSAAGAVRLILKILKRRRQQRLDPSHS